jgi:hypothetical protein
MTRFFQVRLLKILKRLIFKITNLKRQNQTLLNRNPNISLKTVEHTCESALKNKHPEAITEKAFRNLGSYGKF